MLTVRLQRVGRKHEPVFRLVLTDSKNSPKSGKFTEVLGNFDARRGEKSAFNSERIKYWIGMGAQVSETVHNLLIDKKIIEGKKINVLPKKKPIVSEKAESPKQTAENAAPAPAPEEKAEEPAREEKPAE